MKGQMGVFLTDDREVAEMFAGIRTDDVGGDPVVCGALVDTAHLTPDMEMYQMPGYDVLDKYGCDTGDLEKSDECWWKAIKEGRVPYPKNMQDWKTSLNTVHSVISMQSIPPNMIMF
jgi:hypothetical protein